SLPFAILFPPLPSLFPYTTLFRSLIVQNLLRTADFRDGSIRAHFSQFRAQRRSNGLRCGVGSHHKVGPMPSELHVWLICLRFAQIGRAHVELQSRSDLVCRLLLEK